MNLFSGFFAGKKNGSVTQTIAIIGVVIVVCLIVAVSAIIFLRKRKKQKPMEIPPSKLLIFVEHYKLNLKYWTQIFVNNFLKMWTREAQSSLCNILSTKSKRQQMISLILISWAKVDLGLFTR